MAFSLGQRIGKYEIREQLGHGGYGLVYAARDTELGRELAIKFLRPDYLTRPQVVQRFLQEARSAAKIVHPGIVTIYECAQTDDGLVYIAMEKLTGESLSARLGERGRLAIDHALELGQQLAAALEAAHRSGIVHRDLKPDNIYLVPDSSVPGGERVKILDFGIAKLNDADLSSDVTGVHTHSMMMLGTPRYMSPEQCKSSATVDHRSDIYTLGCILYEMLSGTSPYDGDGGELIAKHQLAPVPKPRAARPEVPAFLDVLVTTMLAKEPKDRPPSMERVREALVACAEGAPWTSRAPTQADMTTPDTTLRGSSGVQLPPLGRPGRAWWLVTAGLVVALVLVLAVALLRGPNRDEQSAALPPTAAPVAALPDAHPPEPGAKELECRRFAADRKWDEVLRCADELARFAPAGDPVVRELTTMGVIEARNATCFVKVQDAVAAKDVAESYRWLDRIDDESVYKEAAADLVDKNIAQMPSAAPPRACNADKLAGRAQQALAQGQYTSALALLEGSLRCRPDPSLYRIVLLAACNAGNAPKAKQYFAKLPQSQQPSMAQLCLRDHIALP